MSNQKEMEPGQVLDIFGELIASLSALAAKVPAQSSTTAIPGGIRPTLEAIESYEEIVYRFRDGARSTYKTLKPYFIESLEAFEAGRVFHAVPPLLQAVEQLVELHKDEKVTFTSAQQDRVRELQRRLEKIVPETTKPEVDLPPPTTY